MFNNCDSKTNGELLFINNMKDKWNVVFDVGCQTYSEFLEFDGEVHYFDPVPEFIDQLARMKNQNHKSYFNAFGLGIKKEQLHYYPRYQSFFDRIKSCHASDEANKVVLNTCRGDAYIAEHGIKVIDFLKIDTEGHELLVLQGFGDELKNVKATVERERATLKEQLDTCHEYLSQSKSSSKRAKNPRTL